jgi:hypothetical protein
LGTGFKVVDSYIDTGCVAVDQEFRILPDHVVLTVKATVPGKEPSPVAEILAVDGSAWNYGAFDRPDEGNSGGDKSATTFYFAVPKKLVSAGGKLMFQFGTRSPVELSNPVESRHVHEGNLAPAIQRRPK